ncbi:thiamine phosphate synthase [Aneurinibacillus sp. BA2021]|nr:thiamine phosphate synthase [Aneurinibacillus sp. BA2021]
MQHALHVLSSGKQPLDEVCRIAAQIYPYVDLFHLREKERTARELWEWLQQLTYNAVPCTRLAINDRADLALASGAAAVQAAYHSLPADVLRQLVPHAWLGVSVHSLAEAKAAEAAGADYVLYGHIFPSASKQGLPGRGLAALQEIVEGVDLPVIALGGITPERTAAVLSTGCTGIAAVSAVMQSSDPVLSVQQFRQAMRDARISPRYAWPPKRTGGKKI